jgi:hypothetical protein
MPPEPGGMLNRDYARRGWAAETGHPSWGPRDPVRTYMQTLHVNTRQTTQTVWAQHAKDEGPWNRTVTQLKTVRDRALCLPTFCHVL